MTDYICYAIYLNAWFGPNGIGTSDWSKAWVMTQEEAHSLCSKHVSHDGTIGMIPVEREFVARLAK